MPATLTDVALNSTAAKALVWIRLISNKSGASYTALAASDGNGYYSIKNVPPGDYQLWEGLSSAVITTLVNPHYQVPPSQINLANPLDYGAKFDGSDDSAAWQLAINDVRDGFYGGVWHPGGTSYAQGLSWYTGVHLFGQGYTRSVLMLFPGSTQPLIRSLDFLTLASQNGATGPGTSDLGIYDFGFHNVSFDGNKANCPAASDVWQIYGYGFVIENVRVRNGARDNVYSEWGPGASAPALGDSMESQWINFKSHDSGRHELNFNGPHDSQFLNSTWYKPGGSNVGRGAWIQAKGGSQFTNCHSWGIGMTETWRLESTNILVNCEGEGGSVSECTILANDCQIKGGLWFGATAQVNAYIFIIGAIGVPVGGTDIDTKILNPGANVTAVNLVNEATHSSFKGIYYGAVPFFTGVPISSDVVEVATAGGAAQVTAQLPANLQIGKFATGAEGNYLEVQGKATGSPPQIVANGVADANIGIKILAKGSGSFFLGSGDATRNSWQFNTAATGLSPLIVVIGPDADIALVLQSKGAGAIALTGDGTHVNYMQFFPAVTGGSPAWYANGPDADITVSVNAKGAGAVILSNNRANWFQATGSTAGNPVTLSTAGSDAAVDLYINAKGAAAQIRLQMGSLLGLQVVGVASAVNFLTTTNAATGNAVRVGTYNSADAAANLAIDTKGAASTIFLRPGAVAGLNVVGVAAAVNNVQVTNSATTVPVDIAAIGTDGNINLRLTPKGTGVVDLNYAVVALGGGAAPTVGTIGGAGPAAAAQNSWLKFNVQGTATFVPAWR